MKIFYFTATGNSLSIAKEIGGELISIPQAIQKGQYEYEDDVIGFVFPTYCCYPPKIVREFLAKAKLKANYKFAIATYGNTMGKGGDGSEMIEFGKLASAAGHKFQYLNSILMVDNFVDTFDIAKEIEKIPSKKIDENLAIIKGDIKARKNYVKDPGFMGKVISKLCKPLVKGQDKGERAKKFIVNDHCIGCGICSKVCPMGNIAVDKVPNFSNKCAACYACLHACPHNAIHLKNERSAVRFRNENVTIKEIIEANNCLN
ncbi:MAG: EFR1 family ferrodoxin [bacterium]|nr:EFR1 family ferrodoxin [bacterium]